VIIRYLALARGHVLLFGALRRRRSNRAVIAEFLIQNAARAVNNNSSDAVDGQILLRGEMAVAPLPGGGVGAEKQ